MNDSLRDEHARITRETILSAAENAFVNPGFTKSSMDEIAKSARVTRGAIYHHFSNKSALFEAVYRGLAAEINAQISSRLIKTNSPLEQLRTSLSQFMDLSEDVRIREIMFRQGPAVLSGKCRDIDREYFLGFISDVMSLIIRERREVSDEELENIVSLSLGLLIESALIIGKGNLDKKGKADLERNVGVMLLGVLTT